MQKIPSATHVAEATSTMTIPAHTAAPTTAAPTVAMTTATTDVTTDVTTVTMTETKGAATTTVITDVTDGITTTVITTGVTDVTTVDRDVQPQTPLLLSVPHSSDEHRTTKRNIFPSPVATTQTQIKLHHP